MNKISEYVVAVLVLIALIFAIFAMVMNNKVYSIVAGAIAIIAVLYSIYLIHSEASSLPDEYTYPQESKVSPKKYFSDNDADYYMKNTKDSERENDKDNSEKEDDYSFSSNNNETSETETQEEDQGWLSGNKKSQGTDEDLDTNLEEETSLQDQISQLREELDELKAKKSSTNNSMESEDNEDLYLSDDEEMPKKSKSLKRSQKTSSTKRVKPDEEA